MPFFSYSAHIGKYILVLYMCSMLSNSCPNSTIAGYQFTTHYDCVNAGYAIAQSTFRNLEEIEEYNKDYIEQSKICLLYTSDAADDC